MTSISLSPQNPFVPVGATQQFTATGTFSNGTNGNLTTSVTWTCFSTTVATVATAGLATVLDEGPTTIQASVGSVNASTTLTGTPSRFRFTGSLINARDTFTATVLQSGKVLVVGGTGSQASLVPTCELYDPTIGTFSKTGNLNVPRFNHTATLLNNGMVLITGGEISDGSGGFTESASAELYDANAGTFAIASSLNQARKNHTATLLGSGLVLIAGGNGLNGDPATAELYDPSTNNFSNTGNLNTPRDMHTATLLNDGTVLIAGGEPSPGGSALTSAELYNPTSGTFSTTGSMNTGSINHTATLLNSGKVVIAGGSPLAFSGAFARAELYDPTAKLFTNIGNLSTPRQSFTATLLSGGNVLFVGGVDNNAHVIATGELYDPMAGAFSLAGNLNNARGFHSAGALNNGLVLIAGGLDTGTLDLSSAETYQSASSDPPPPSLRITPAVSNVPVGGTQQFTAIDNNGIPRQDVTWSVSNTTLASVTTNPDGTGLLDALATGQITLTATDGTVTAQEPVTILSQSSFTSGPTIWSAAPPPAGFSVQQLVQAVPSVGGPDFYSISTSADGTQSVIQALTADGEQIWQTQIPPVTGTSVPDAFGGIVITTCASGSPMTVMDLDPMGQPLWQQLSLAVTGYGYICYAPQTAVRSDGVAFIAEPTNAGLPSLTEAYPSGYINAVEFPPSTVTNNGRQTQVNCCVGTPMVNTDGTAYVEYEVRTTNNNVITSDTLYLYNATTSSSAVLSSTTQNEALLPGPSIPDGNGGVLATWTVSSPVVQQYPYQAADVTNGVVGTPYSLPFSPQSVTPFVSPTLVLGENGTAFASGSTSVIVNGAQTSMDQIASFNLSSGVPNWTYQGAQGTHLTVIEVTFGNGLAAKSTDQNGIDTVLLFNASGGQSQAMLRTLKSTWKPMALTPSGLSGLSNVDYFVNGWWVGTSNGTAFAVLGNLIQAAMSSYAHDKGNSKQRGGQPIVDTFEPVDPAPQWLAVDFQTRYGQTKNLNSVSLSALTTSVPRVNGSATWEKFRTRPQTVQALAFIGHSFDSIPPAPVRAIGLCFAGAYCVERETVPGDFEYCPNPGCFLGYADNPPLVNVVEYPAPSPVSQALIVFIAACNMDANMQSWLGITNTTAGRALLVPQNTTDIDLDMGEYEWLRILAYLTSGKNLKQAVSSANADVVAKAPWHDVSGNIVPPQAWQVVGDSGNGGTGIHF